MNIPEEVLERADEAFFDAEGDGLTASYAVIAEWARREAFVDVVDALIGATRTVEGWRAPTKEIGSHYSSVRDGLLLALETVRDVRDGRALVEGEPK